DGQWNGVWGILRVYNGRMGLKTDLLALPNNTAGAADVTTNDTEFPVDSTFPNGATDFKDTTDPSVLTYSTVTTDTTLMSPTMLGTASLSSSSTSTTTQQAALIGPVLLDQDIVISNPTDFATAKTAGTTICPGTAPKRRINVTAVNAF